MEKGYLEQKTGDGDIGEQDGEMAVREAGYRDGKYTSIFRAVVSDSGEAPHLHTEHL